MPLMLRLSVVTAERFSQCKTGTQKATNRRNTHTYIYTHIRNVSSFPYKTNFKVQNMSTEHFRKTKTPCIPGMLAEPTTPSVPPRKNKRLNSQTCSCGTDEDSCESFHPTFTLQVSRAYEKQLAKWCIWMLLLCDHCRRPALPLCRADSACVCVCGGEDGRVSERCHDCCLLASSS